MKGKLNLDIFVLKWNEINCFCVLSVDLYDIYQELGIAAFDSTICGFYYCPIENINEI